MPFHALVALAVYADFTTSKRWHHRDGFPPQQGDDSFPPGVVARAREPMGRVG